MVRCIDDGDDELTKCPRERRVSHSGRFYFCQESNMILKLHVTPLGDRKKNCSVNRFGYNSIPRERNRAGEHRMMIDDW